MNYSKYKFTLNTQCPTSQRSIPVKLGDTARSLYITFVDGGTPYSLPDGCRAVFFAKKPDEAELVNDCIIENNKTVRYDFTAQTANVSGITECEIRIYGENGMLLSTPKFVINVDERVVYDDSTPLSDSESTAWDNIFLHEQQRVSAEEERKAAEANRQSSFSAMANEVTAAANDAKNVASTLNEKLATGDFNGKDGKNGDDGKNGENGKDGLTPYVGPNGNWWIGGVDTHSPSTGKDGVDGKNYNLSVDDKIDIANIVLLEFPFAEEASV